MRYFGVTILAYNGSPLRLRRENEDLKLLHEANLLMIDMAKERFGIDIKKNYEEMLSGG